MNTTETRPYEHLTPQQIKKQLQIAEAALRKYARKEIRFKRIMGLKFLEIWAGREATEARKKSLEEELKKRQAA